MLAFLPSTVRIIGAEACGKRGNPSKTRKTAMATGHASLTSTLLAGAALLLASAGANAQTSGYTFTTINDPLGTGTWGTQAYGINDAGQVVGAYEDSSNVFHGFLDINGNYTTIDAPGASRTSVNGINNAGQMTVEASTGSFIDTNGTLTAVNVPGTKSVLTSINGINSAALPRARPTQLLQ